MSLKKYITGLAKKNSKLKKFFVDVAHQASPETVVVLDYPIILKQRWDENNPHQGILDVLNKNRDVYRANLEAFSKFSKNYLNISAKQPVETQTTEPYWINGWLPGLDGVALYGFLVTQKPKIYMEVGSGNSTKFARRAITDHNLDTKIVSIDPCPRTEINDLCDEVIRKPLEEVDLEIFDRLEANDILFVDNSHRVFMNSDATTIFLDVLPRLKSGVLVEIHDIELPYDYPTEWLDRYYSEQYVLAAYILAKGALFDTILPNALISRDQELKSILCPLWENNEMKSVERHGGSFWVKMK